MFFPSKKLSFSMSPLLMMGLLSLVWPSPAGKQFGAVSEAERRWGNREPGDGRLGWTPKTDGDPQLSQTQGTVDRGALGAPGSGATCGPFSFSGNRHAGDRPTPHCLRPQTSEARGVPALLWWPRSEKPGRTVTAAHRMRPGQDRAVVPHGSGTGQSPGDPHPIQHDKPRSHSAATECPWRTQRGAGSHPCPPKLRRESSAGQSDPCPSIHTHRTPHGEVTPSQQPSQVWARVGLLRATPQSRRDP